MPIEQCEKCKKCFISVDNQETCPFCGHNINEKVYDLPEGFQEFFGFKGGVK